MCAFRDSADELRRLDATVVGVSVDTFFALKGWAVAEQIPFTLLSDFNKQVTPLYGVLNPDMIGLKNIAYRATFVIGRDGVVRYAQVLDDARNEPDYDAVKEALASA